MRCASAQVGVPRATTGDGRARRRTSLKNVPGLLKCLIQEDAWREFSTLFFPETGVERAKVPHTPQPAAYHSIVQLYVCGCWRCRGTNPSGSDNGIYVSHIPALFQTVRTLCGVRDRCYHKP